MRFISILAGTAGLVVAHSRFHMPIPKGLPAGNRSIVQLAIGGMIQFDQQYGNELLPDGTAQLD
jgi:hypothetical protein